MTVIFVHGWSVRNTDTYGALPQRLREANLGVRHLYLSEYVSFNDQVTVDDIARAFHQLVQERIPAGERFACITHSTGGPVARAWMDLFYGPERLRECPMSHLVMLAPANHGSALAALGKSRLSRMKFFVEGVEPGERVLDWLELGSEGQWALNQRALDYRYAERGVYPFVLTGQRIDRSLYDHLNPYTGEPGSDGVVRVCAANMNFASIELAQDERGELHLERCVRSPRVPFGVLPGLSHSGETMGILRSVAETGDHPTVEWVLRCLAVASEADYRALDADLDFVTRSTQRQERVETAWKLAGQVVYPNDRHSMFTFRLRDDRGAPLSDYDLLLTAGPGYDPDELPDGFFRDRQRNSVSPGRLTYYVNHDRMLQGLEKPGLARKLGFRVVARPDAGFARYAVAELRSDIGAVAELLLPNQTAMVDVKLRRNVSADVYRFSPTLQAGEFGVLGRRVA
jgi:hypothetical protein